MAAPTMPINSSPSVSGGISRSMIVPWSLPASSEKLELAKAFCIMPIMIRPGATKVAKLTPEHDAPAAAHGDREDHEETAAW
jgi:hypothetical protein